MVYCFNLILIKKWEDLPTVEMKGKLAIVLPLGVLTCMNSFGGEDPSPPKTPSARGTGADLIRAAPDAPMKVLPHSHNPRRTLNKTLKIDACIPQSAAI